MQQQTMMILTLLQRQIYHQLKNSSLTGKIPRFHKRTLGLTNVINYQILRTIIISNISLQLQVQRSAYEFFRYLQGSNKNVYGVWSDSSIPYSIQGMQNIEFSKNLCIFTLIFDGNKGV